MELKIEKQTENKLLKRNEIEFYAMGDGKTPSRKEVKDSLQQKLKVDADLIVIHRLESSYGMSQIRGKAMVYKDKKSMSVEHEYMLKRDRKGQDKKEEKPAEKKEDEAAVEEKKE